LAEATHFPVLADPLSGARFHPKIEHIVGGYDSFLRSASWETPDVILHFGAAPTSQALDDYLNQIMPFARVAISHDGQWHDPNHRLTDFIWADPFALAERVAKSLFISPSTQLDEAWVAQIAHAEAVAWEVIDAECATGDYFDGAALADVVEQLPNHAMLYVASSLPVRHLDQFAKPNTKALRVFANRGASGIDGTISSALGAAASNPDLPLTLVTGDLAFYHDMNGLMAIKRLGIKATIVVINNDGGGIFYRLPVAKFDPPFTDLFVTPHALNFEPAARMYGLEYTLARDRESFRAAFAASLESPHSTIIEVPSNAEHDLARRNEIVSRVVERMKAAIEV
jgi:2-succinyl-5-enolpyruvyl-6-hydroxy-3-cyclohexene-1-carboxylate synthase